MKKIFAILAAAAFLCLPLRADDKAILDKILQANSSVKTVQCDFARNRVIVATSKKTDSKGTLYLSVPDKLTMEYAAPSTELLVINGDRLYLRKGKTENNYDLGKNALMKSLASTLINCITGRVGQVADENDADINVEERGGEYIVTLLARKEAPRGYARISLNYRKSDGALVKMEMEEFNGIISTYTISGVRKDISSIPAVKFEIPSRTN